MKTLLMLFISAWIGAAPAPAPDRARTFTLALQQRNLDILEQAVHNMSNYKHQDYGKFWSIDQILDLVAPNPEVNFLVNRYFEQSGSDIVCNDFRDAMICTGNARDVFQLDSNGNWIIPESLQGLVTLVDGRFDNSQSRSNTINPKRRVRSAPLVDPGYVGVESVRKLYNIPDVVVSEDVLAVEYQGHSGYSNSDLTLSQSENGLYVNPISPNHTIGPNGWSDTETELDVQMLTYANNASVWFWDSDQWLLTWAVNFFNTPVVPYVTSHSWGWAIDQQCTIIPCPGTDQAYVNRVNIEYLKIAARGVTILAASGDSGAPGRSDEVCSGTNRTVVSVFPGSSPYVLSVGATFVVDSGSEPDPINTRDRNWNWTTPLCQQNRCATGTTEAVVNFANVSWTSGGGFGDYETEVQPIWQAEAVDHYFSLDPPLPTHFNPAGRAYPDLSVVGHNCPVWQGGSLGPVDGTSCSSPLMGSIIALINSHQRALGKPRLGLAAPILYAMYYDDHTIFHDITVGNNWCTEALCCNVRPDGGSDYGYVATEGFDPVTGLGTPNVGKMLEWLDKHT